MTSRGNFLKLSNQGSDLERAEDWGRLNLVFAF